MQDPRATRCEALRESDAYCLTSFSQKLLEHKYAMGVAEPFVGLDIEKQVISSI